MVLARRGAGTGTTGTGTTGRRSSWDVIRVLAIGAVLLFHSTYWGHVVAPGIAPAPFQMPYQFGASTLMVVSAFFAAETLRRYTGLRWWLRRLARLVPAYATAVVAIFLIVHAFAPAEYYHPTLVDLLGNLLLLHMWIPGVNFVDGSFWTMPIQVGAFTAMAALAYLPAVRRRPAPVLWGAVLVPLVVRWTAMQHEPREWLLIVMDGSGLGRAHLFVAGAAIWLWAGDRIGSRHLLALLTAVLVAQHTHPPAGDSVGGFAIMLTLICLAARGRDWTLPAPLTRSVKWIAGISYGVYLMHQNVGYIIARRFSDAGVNSWVWLAVFIGTAILLGWALTVLVERPAYRWWTRRRSTNATDRADRPNAR